MKASSAHSLIPLLALVLMLAPCETAPQATAPVSPYPKLSLISPPEAPCEKALRPANPRYEIWRPGYWSYNDGKFTWKPGCIMPRPEPTAIWSPDRWERRAYGWAYIPGHWQ